MAAPKGTGCKAMFEPGDRFMDCWPGIRKVISADYYELVAQTPTRIEKRDKDKETQDEKKKDKKKKNKDEE